MFPTSKNVEKITPIFSSFPIYAVAALCILPFLLSLLGVDFSSESHSFSKHLAVQPDTTKAQLTDHIFNTITGGLQHGLLEWSSVMIAFLTILIGFSHFAIKKDITTPIICIALFCSGTMDAFHTLAAMRLIDASAENSNLIPFTWAISRSFNAAILILGVIICLRWRSFNAKIGILRIICVGILFSAIASFLIQYAATSEHLPQTQFPHALITRPYDVLPLILFILAAPIFLTLYKRQPNLLNAALCIALIPEIILETHMAFGSTALFDHNFNIAHGLKILAYFIPFVGLMLDYIKTYQLQQHLTIKEDIGRKRLQTILDNTVDGIITINAQGIVSSFNLASEKLFGFSAREVIGNNIKMLMPDPYHSQHDTYLESYKKTSTKKVIGIGREVTAQRKDGSTFPIELSVSEAYIGNAPLYTGIIRDISERKITEEFLHKTLEDLNISNEELSKFAFVASHDLKSPLRAIDHLSRWIEEDLAEHLDEKNKDRMNKLRGRISRMEHLLDDLLEYSKAGRNLENIESIEAPHLIHDISTLLHTPHGISITADKSLENITIPRMPLEQIFHNLISNAIKHHHKEEGEIIISAKEQNDFYEFSVSDDGPGIPEKYHSRIFEMFQTLQSRDVVEGSGMGLALVKKLANQFGGRVWVSSQEGDGATFFFSWPKNPEKHSQTKRKE